VAAVPEPIWGLSLITQPHVSAKVVSEALAVGIRHFWFQPGAEHPGAIAEARAAQSRVISGGPCLLVVLRYDARSEAQLD
jgi:predicted CoA-binding protein